MPSTVPARRGAADYDQLLAADSEDDSVGGWMVSYIDVMTLLVALFVILLSLSALRSDALAELEEEGKIVSLAEVPEPLRLGVPLPEGALIASRPAMAMAPLEPTIHASESRLSPQAVVIALGVARRGSTPSRHVVLDEPAMSQVATETPALDDEVIQVTSQMVEAVTRQRASLAQLPSLEGVEVSHVAEGISLRVDDHLLFPSAEAQLTGSGREVIESLVEIIQRYAGEVSVEGHSDSRPISTPQFPSNWELSSSRATAILRYLSQAGVAESRLKAVGFGSTRPLESNDSEEGRARNRRVEVIIHLE
ncbi:MULTISPECIES: OmpA family protein [Halomonadaceae]|uniref:OmpA family protein n=1 Tax=Halomonadaceae TaxID=28256 RepID=UPI0015998860|nr:MULTISPECIES: OmpA family protein [Halomonas]QJQ96550.1 OmpA family protein [Halomonas sp. PA5]